MVTASAAFRTRSGKAELTRVLSVDVPASQGVGLDGILPSSVDLWSSRRKQEMARFVSDKLRSDSYRFTNYREGLISRGRYKIPRQISIPTVRDRLALRALALTLRDVFGYSGPEPSQRKVARLVDAATSGTYTHYVKIDIQEYYGSIRHETLLGLVSRKVRSTKVQGLLERAIRNPVVAFGEKSKGLSSNPDGIPIGVSISSVLAEIYLEDFDASLSFSGIHAFRYVDDIVLLTNGPKALFEPIRERLHRLGLRTHDMGTTGKCESGELAQGFDYLGYTVTSRSSTVARPGVRRIESQLAQRVAAVGSAYKSGNTSAMRAAVWRLNITIGGCLIAGEARGWVRYYNRITNLTVLGHLDALVDQMLRRYGISGRIRPKSFISAYWASRDNARFQIFAFNLDRMTVVECRQHLSEVEGWSSSEVSRLGDIEVQATVRRFVRRQIVQLERDFEPAS